MNSNPFALNEHDTTAAFIDGPALYWAYKALNTEEQIDMIKMKKLIENNSRLQNISYYTVFPPAEKRDADGYTPLKPFTEFLGYNGFRVVTEDAYSYSTDLGMRTKGTIMPHVICDAITAAYQGMNHILLFVSDNDYHPAITAIQAAGSRCTVVSTNENKIMSDNLIWLADNFVDLSNLKALIGRERR